MKALVYTAPEVIELKVEPDPAPAAGEALVRVDAVGICGSDMHAWHGHDERRVPPMILGHEAAGTVVEGENRGRRVTMNPMIPCGECLCCLVGRTNICKNCSIIGMTRPGAFAQYVTIPESCLIDLPEGLEPLHAALSEPTATSWHAVNLAERTSWRPLAEMDTLVIGGGSIGLLTALILRARGVHSVRLAETNKLRRETAATAGIQYVDPVDTQLSANCAHIVFDAVGSAKSRQLAIHAVHPGGAIIHIGLTESGGEMDIRKITLREIAFVGSYTYTRADLASAVDALYRGVLGDLSWVEARPLSDGAAAFADLDAGRTAAAKIVLLPG
jgi:alcohol dehydrogenase